MLGCIDLQVRFGRRYRVTSEHGRMARRRDPWMLLIPCKFGHLYPFGGDLLAASIDGHSKVAARLRKLSCCRIWQDGDNGELTVVFDVADLAEVARIIRPRQRRRLSPEQRAQQAARMHAVREMVAGRPTKRQYTAQGRDETTSGDSEAAKRRMALFAH